MRHLTFLVLAALCAVQASSAPLRAKPNIIFILADDLGYGDLSCYGQQQFRTPNIDRLAHEGMKFTAHYSGHNVCAPARCVLMSGKHPGHGYIRENRGGLGQGAEGQQPVPAGELRLPLALHRLGYAVGGFGKWGLGPVGSTGDPLKQGFDRFYGYNCQAVAHNYYPTYLWSNEVKVALANPSFAPHQKLPLGADPDSPATYAAFIGRDYAPDLIAEQARKFIRENKERPFFLYYATTVPHLALQVPMDSLREFEGRFPETPYLGGRGYLPQRTPRAAYAAMITRMDREVGRLIDLVKELALDENTIFIFTSDHGPLYDGVGGTDTDFFNSAAGLRGRKGSYYEGGFREPCLVRWKGKIAPGTATDRVTGFEDWLPTLLDLIGEKKETPGELDGISFAPTLRGKKQKVRPFLYRESPGYGGQQCVRVGNWKLVRQHLNPEANRETPPAPTTELYDLAQDPRETTDVAARHPDVVAKLAAVLRREHVPSVLWPMLRLTGTGANQTEGRLDIKLARSTPEVFERVEMSVGGVPAADNPFDPESIAVDLEVKGPSGKTARVPAFFQREFSRKLEGDTEILVPEGDGGWRIRWLPLEPGRHTLVVTVTLAGEPAGRGEAAVEVAEGKRHGLVGVEPSGKRAFRLTDGTPLFLNGLCACWHGKRGSYDYDDWLAAYQKAGMNYIRIWMWHQAFGIEWDREDKLHYRLDNAWRLDRVLTEAERSGIFVMLCLDYHGIFEVKPDFWGSNNFWPRHPYNAANGGPCKTQNDFFTSSEARKLYQKRLRYLVARWSAFPNILSWEFFNEIDNEYAYLKHEAVVDWHRDMGRHLRSIDPVRHLISSSFTGGSERPDLFALPEMDFAQYHSYNEKHPARMMAEKSARFFEKYQKPFFVSEYGTDWKGWKPDTDPHLRALHQAIWSGAFTGAAGTGMTWWWENIHTANLYPHWSALADFLGGTGIGRADLRLARFENADGPVTPFGVAAHDEALVWLLDRACDWPDGAMAAHPAPVEGAKVTLTGLDNGLWSVEWWDTLTGKRVAEGSTTATAGALQLEPPAFHADIAARLKKR